MDSWPQISISHNSRWIDWLFVWASEWQLTHLFMLHLCGFLDQLEQLMPLEDGIIYTAYGDPVYPHSDYIHSRHCNPVPGSDDAKYNTIMSGCGICAEWSFKEVTQQFKWLDFSWSLCIWMFPVGQYYTFAAFLTNLHSILYGNQMSLHFNADLYTLGCLLMAYKWDWNRIK